MHFEVAVKTSHCIQINWFFSSGTPQETYALFDESVA